MEKVNWLAKIGTLVGYTSWIVVTSWLLLPHAGLRVLPHLSFALLLSVLFWWGTLRSLTSGKVEGRVFKVLCVTFLFLVAMGFYYSRVIAPEVERYPALVEQLRELNRPKNVPLASLASLGCFTALAIWMRRRKRKARPK